MPCNSVVELIQVVIDDRDRLKDYQFVKKSCGQGVGNNSLLIDILRGMSVDELLEVDAESLLAVDRTDDEVLEFLRLKHLFAVQATLEVLTGRLTGGKGQSCAVADVAYDGDETIMNAEIDVDVITEQIAACAGCKGGCGQPIKT